MEGPKLYAFGCSNTYGEGLPDCNFQKGIPSNMGWVSIVAKHLKLPHINLSFPGASIKEITFKVKHHQHNITKNDIVIILWTYPSRWCIINDIKTNDIDRYLSHSESNINKMYYKYFHNDEDSYLMNEVFITYIQNKLDKIGCNYKFIFNSCLEQQKYRENGINMMNVNFNQFDNEEDRTACGHMGLQGNIDFANAIIKEAF